MKVEFYFTFSCIGQNNLHSIRSWFRFKNQDDKLTSMLMSAEHKLFCFAHVVGFLFFDSPRTLKFGSNWDNFATWSPTGVFTPTTRRNCRQLFANSCTHRRRRRDKTVSSRRRRRCVLGIRWLSMMEKPFKSCEQRCKTNARSLFGRSVLVGNFL